MPNELVLSYLERSMQKSAMRIDNTLSSISGVSKTGSEATDTTNKELIRATDTENSEVSFTTLVKVIKEKERDRRHRKRAMKARLSWILRRKERGF